MELTPSALASFIKKNLPNTKIIVKGEVSQPKISSGHMYFNLKDNFTNIKVIAWKSKSELFDLVIEGSEITCTGKIDYYGGNSTLSLIIDNIKSDGIMGELFVNYNKIKEEFTKNGYFSKQKKPLPNIINNICIITSAGGAAIQDFNWGIDNSGLLLKRDIIDVQVQGIDCPKNICIELEKLQNSDYDLILITRGGGSFSDLFGFSQPELIESVYNFNLPVLSAIGHQIDNPLLDLVADYSSPTPSLASQFIVEHNKKYINNNYEILDNIKYTINNSIKYRKNILDKYLRKITKIQEEIFEIPKNIKNNIEIEINSRKNQLDLYLKQIKLIENTKDIKILNINKREILNPNRLIENQKIIIEWNGVKINAIISLS